MTEPPGRPFTVQIGARFGDYQLVGLLGEGGMGFVYKALQISTQRYVALKVIRRQGATAVREQRFVREAQLTAALRDPGIVRVHSAGEVQGVRYIAYELVDGARQLDEAWVGRPALERVAWIRDAARAVGVAHAQAIVHRDLKPANVLVDGDGRVHVADFGLASMVGLEALTFSGQIVGTPSHMSPEQVSGLRPTPQTDVWGLGVILYEALTDRLPFDGDTLLDQMAQILSVAPDPPGTLVPGLPPALNAVCLRALARATEDRYADAEALAQDLDVALAGGDVAWVQPRRRVASHVMWLIPSLALALLAGAAVLAFTEPRSISRVPAGSETLGDRDEPVGSEPRESSDPTSKISAPAAPSVRVSSPVSLETVVKLLATSYPGEAEQVSGFRKHAIDGDVHSIGKVGNWYLRGEKGVPQAVNEGLTLLTYAAENGDAAARTDLAYAYYEGLPGVLEPDRVRGARLFEQAAAEGEVEAQLWLGNLYAYSHGQDRKRALGYYDAAVKKGSRRAMRHRGVLYRDHLNDPGRAFADLREAIERGEPSGWEELELLLLQERDVGRPLLEAEAWIRDQVREGVPPATHVLGRGLMGTLVGRDPQGHPLLRIGDRGYRALEESLELRVNGALFAEAGMGQRVKRTWTVRGDVAHLWTVWMPGVGEPSPSLDLLSARFGVRVASRPISTGTLSTLTEVTTVEAPETGTFAFVSEDPKGRLSNVVFMSVTAPVPPIAKPSSEPLAARVDALVPPKIPGDPVKLGDTLRRRARDSGNPRAITKLGGALFRGSVRVPCWPLHGLALLDLAAELGDPLALAILGEIALRGRPGIVERDPARARELLVQSLRLGGDAATAGFGQLVMGEQALRSDRDGLALRWGRNAQAPYRPLSEKLDLRLDGVRYLELKSGARNAYRFEMPGDMAHLWSVWNPGGWAEDFDVLARDDAETTRKRSGDVVSSTRVDVERDTDAPQAGVWVYVAENRAGQLSNPVFIQILAD